MELPKIKERAFSYIEYSRKHFDSSPQMRPLEAGDVPPPISLSPGMLENSKALKDLKLEKEQDQYLISVLKKHCYTQSKEIEKLRSRLESLQKDYENLARNQIKPRKFSIIETALLVRSRSESVNASV